MADRLHDDDALLEALGAALVGQDEPSMAELAAFSRVVEAGAAGRRSKRWRAWAAGVLAGGIVLSGGTAYATNPVAPRPVRSAAFALKLPVESPDLTDAKDALDDLEEELHEGRRDKVAAEVEDVEEELADLSPSARAPLAARAESLLSAAAAFLADPLTVEPVGEDETDEEEADDEVDDSSGSGSGSSGSGSDDDSSGSGSSGSGTDDDDRSGSGSGSSGSGSDDDSSGSGSGSGSSGSGSGRD